MTRYIRLFLYFLRFSFSKAMEFRVDFFFRIVMDIVFYAINILFYEAIFLHTNLLGGWNRDEMLVFVGGFLVVDALSMTLFSNNLFNISMFVNRGDLDYYLIRPVSSLFFLSLRDFAANSFMNLVMAFGILFWALWRLPNTPGIAEVAGFIMLLGVGTYLRYLVRLLTIIPVFWTHSGHGLEVLFFHFARFVERPDAIFTGIVRRILTTALPFLIMVSYPARLVLDPFEPTVLVHLLGVTVAFSVGIGVLWRRGLRAYSSASS